MAFLVEKIERMWYNCIDVGWEIQNGAAGLYVASADQAYNEQNQREKGHVKDLTCINPGCNGDITKNIEVRYCDNFGEMMQEAEELHREYYL